MRCETGVIYVSAVLDATALDRLLRPLLSAGGIDVRDLPEGLRIRETEAERFWFNYNAFEVTFDGQTFPAAHLKREILV